MTTRRTALVATAAAGLLATPLALAAPASASDAPYRVTARVSQSVVHSGDVFAVRGKYVYLGRLVKGGHVQVQMKRDGRWRNVRGAKVVTNRHGRYRVRLSLSQVGKRRLCVLAWQDNTQGVAVKRFAVTVRR